MKRFAVFALLAGFGSAATGETSATVYMADGNTPLEWADPNVSFVYPDVMVGTKLTIVISSDTNDFWSGRLEIKGPDMDYALLGARDHNDVTLSWEGSVLEGAGDGAKVWGYGDSLATGFDMRNGLTSLPGDWFIVDYIATNSGDCRVQLHEWRMRPGTSFNPDNPDDEPSADPFLLQEFVFSHVPSRDFNGDTNVDFVDFAIISAFRGRVDCTNSNWCEGADLDTDGDVDLNDMMLFGDYWLESTD